MIEPAPNGKKRWSAGDEAVVREWYLARGATKLDLVQLARALGRSFASVAVHAGRMGLGVRSRPTGRKVTRKYPTNDESRAAIGRSTKERIAREGHPRGARGLRHTPEHLARMQAAAKEWRDSASPAVLRDAADRALATRLAKYGTLAPGNDASRNPYSRTKYGKRADLGGQFFRSRWEANYARFLNWRVARGDIRRWEYEAETFWFEAIRRGVRSYTPDFRITANDGTVYFDEVKGWMDAKSVTKIARMGRYHPAVDLRVIDAKRYRIIERTLASIIPGWE